MGSRLMHAAIATLLMAKYHQLDTTFLVGNEAPDVDKINQMTKDETHYLVPSNRGTRRVDLRAFLQDHPETLSDSFNLGYYTHLLTDEIWLTDVFMNVVPPQDDPRRPAVLERYYEDFKKLNPYLVHKYGLQPLPSTATEAVPADFADKACVEKLIQDYNADFTGETIGDLEVLSITQIDVYIANVVNLMTKVIDSGIFVEK
ncbi:zinc dependent phospholipase C family protein [Weissella confusa]|uniref:Zinc dependent phospholipase C family protein n=1 Tax=Weissella fermenti TaxID=2987699 RepID=A0ABT6D8I4_9LACO|nr:MULTISPECIES: zinc dependent phospholipase C family protein [Weissella]MBJ7689227.1 zinc dependent phospholipase C family protein [Weissella confusa]MCW0927861.1 zinc dependent phospholipase C family protein [Weissella sp. LMG 11983]MDF9300840.1 zinc dependent phospholipase C family protein [Weissella sp. BK2]